MKNSAFPKQMLLLGWTIILAYSSKCEKNHQRIVKEKKKEKKNKWTN